MKVGVARTRITPPSDVPLGGTGLPWSRVSDHLSATALVLAEADGKALAALASVDVAAADTSLLQAVQQAMAPLSLPVYVGVTGSPRSPSLLQADAHYFQHVARQLATAIVLARRSVRAASLRVGSAMLAGWTQHREAPQRPVDQRLVLWRFDDEGRRPLAAVLTFAAPADVQQVLAPQEISRDYPGQVTDLLERELPGVTALFLPAAAQDSVFRSDCYTPERCHTPGVAIAQCALQCWRRAQLVDSPPGRCSVSHAPFSLEWPLTALQALEEATGESIGRLREQRVQELLLVRRLSESNQGK